MNVIEHGYAQFCTERFPFASEEQIRLLETRIGAEFPPDYRRFVAEFNGGYFCEPDIEPVVADCHRDRLTALHGIGAPMRFAELANDADLGLFEENDPLEILPIGVTMMGGLIILVMHDEDAGAILLKKARGGAYFLARGIEEFFGLLRSPDP